MRGVVGGKFENATKGEPRSSEEDLMLGYGRVFGYPMLALAERGVPATFATDAMVHHVAESQVPGITPTAGRYEDSIMQDLIPAIEHRILKDRVRQQ